MPGSYTPAVRILFVCTANQCRSPMAEVLLRGMAPPSVSVSSAGLLPGGAPAAALADDVVGGLAHHLSRQLTRDLVVESDLILGMTREHVRVIVSTDPDAFGRTFALKELIRRADQHGPRQADEDVDAWLRRISVGRRWVDLLEPSLTDDIPDPMGLPRASYLQVAGDIRDHVSRLAAILWPAAG